MSKSNYDRFKFLEAYLGTQLDYEDNGYWDMVITKGRWDLIELYNEYKILKRNRILEQ